jgi:Fe2+ or Zn2+ uptake regulation protein
MNCYQCGVTVTLILADVARLDADYIDHQYVSRKVNVPFYAVCATCQDRSERVLQQHDRS